MDRTPVPGWVAMRKDVRIKSGQEMESYIVLDCPEFFRDAKQFGLERVKNEVPQHENGGRRH